MTANPTLRERSTLPLPALIVLAVIGFTTMLTETIPAGLLGDIGGALDASDSVTGQLLTAYAAASMLAAIPLTTLTRTWARKPLLVATVAGIVSANVITAVSSELYLTAAARIVAGACAGIQWAMMAGYAMRMVDSTLKGRALSIAMAGIPIALAFGIPLGTLLGSAVGWRGVFIILGAIGTLAGVLATIMLPSCEGEKSTSKLAIKAVLRRPGIALIVVGAFAFQAAHMNMYTYIEPYLRLSDLDRNVGAVLLALGVAAIAGLWVTGVTVDRHLTALGIAVLSLFCVAMGAMGLFAGSPPFVVIAAITWGCALGCAPTLYQTACARAAGQSIDIAQAVLVTLFNAGMAAGSLLGGIALWASNSAHTLPWISFAIFAALLAVTTATRAVSLPRLPKTLVGSFSPELSHGS
ncbi:MAG: MFS transporter [Mycobacterium sp.]